ncbi:hypothetical protein [Fibrella aquatilis]|uniref:Lipocalin-like domain-containing protein n=1 Tax=Fibrella aquatilis TaxID=2817059 RepID=A0A939JXW0_9BACT|nr:hypothetical protein [Fibrella aquatilis]MBO0933382.1 hypothetical protein [Fibrella aquatilis]
MKKGKMFKVICIGLLGLLLSCHQESVDQPQPVCYTWALTVTSTVKAQQALLGKWKFLYVSGAVDNPNLWTTKDIGATKDITLVFRPDNTLIVTKDGLELAPINYTVTVSPPIYSPGHPGFYLQLSRSVPYTASGDLDVSNTHFFVCNDLLTLRNELMMDYIPTYTCKRVE